MAYTGGSNLEARDGKTVDTTPVIFSPLLIQALLNQGFHDALLDERIYVPLESSTDLGQQTWTQLTDAEKDERSAAKRAEHAKRVARMKAFDVVTVAKHLRTAAEVKSNLGTLYLALAMLDFPANCELKPSIVFGALKLKLETLGATVTTIPKPTIVVAPQPIPTVLSVEVSSKDTLEGRKLGKRKKRNLEKKKAKTARAAAQRLEITLKTVQKQGLDKSTETAMPLSQIAIKAGSYYFSVDYPTGDLPEFAGLSQAQLEDMRLAVCEKLIDLSQFLMSQLEVSPKVFSKMIATLHKNTRHVLQCEALYAKIKGNRHRVRAETRPIRIIASDAHYAGISIICEHGCGKYVLAKMHGVELGLPASTGTRVLYTNNAASNECLVFNKRTNGKKEEVDLSTVPSPAQIEAAKTTYRNHAKQYPNHILAVVIRGKVTHRLQLEEMATQIRESFPSRKEKYTEKNKKTHQTVIPDQDSNLE